MARILATLTALLGAASLSQGPEFGQQYVQRLGGAVDELARFVEQFNSDADAAGLSRQEALEAYARSGDFLSVRGVRVADTIRRYEQLSADLAAMRGADAFTRTWLIARRPDMPLIRATMNDYRPAAPLTAAGAVHAGVGAGLGGLLGVGLGGLLRPFSRRRGARA